MMSAVRAAAVVALLAPPAHAAHAQAASLDVPAGTYALDPTHTSVTWAVKHLGLSMYTARFVGFDSTVRLDPADPTRSSVVFTIDPASVRTDFPFPEKEDFDSVVANRFLKAEAHPEIRFQSTAITATGPNGGQISGTMTLGGVTKPVTFDATLNGAMLNPFTKAPTIGLSARGTIKRSEFGLDELLGPIGDDVEIRIEAEFAKAD
jgi:polyisoprenoid-binding protein YceI